MVIIMMTTTEIMTRISGTTENTASPLFMCFPDRNNLSPENNMAKPARKNEKRLRYTMWPDGIKCVGPPVSCTRCFKKMSNRSITKPNAKRANTRTRPSQECPFICHVTSLPGQEYPVIRHDVRGRHNPRQVLVIAFVSRHLILRGVESQPHLITAVQCHVKVSPSAASLPQVAMNPPDESPYSLWTASTPSNTIGRAPSTSAVICDIGGFVLCSEATSRRLPGEEEPSLYQGPNRSRPARRRT